MFSCISGNWSTRDIQILDRKKCIFIPGKPPWQLCQCIQRIPFQGWVILMSILILIWHLKPPIKKEVICSLIPRPFLSTIWSNIGVDLSHHLHCYQCLTSIILKEIELTMVRSFTANWLYWLHRTLKLNMNCDPFLFNCHNLCRKFCEVSQYGKFSTSSMWHCFLANRQMWKRTPLHIQMKKTINLRGRKAQ